MDWVGVANFLSLITPIALLFYFLFVHHISYVVENVIHFKDNVLTIYFSHYRPAFYPGHAIRSVLKILFFFVSFTMIVMSAYIFTIFLMSYIFGIEAKHTDTLLLMIALAVASIRILVQREGGQKAEIFGWIVSILLLCWLVVGYASHFWETIKPFLLHYTSLTQYFSENHLIKEAVINNLPKNPLVVFSGFLVAVVVEILNVLPWTAERLSTVPCNAWVLCHEIAMDMSRITGRKFILGKVFELLDICERDSIAPIWVTTTYDSRIVDKLRVSTMPSASIVALTDKGRNGASDWEDRQNVKFRLLLNSYNTGFLLLPRKAVLVTTQHPMVKDIGEPMIGYYSTDIYMVNKYLSIYNQLVNPT